MTQLKLFKNILNIIINIRILLVIQFLLFLLYFQFNQSGFTNPNIKRTKENKTLVLYAYFEKNTFYAETLKFLIDIGVKEIDPVDYIFIIQGNKSSVRIPKYKNIKVIKRIQNDCYDFGSYGEILSQHIGLKNLFEYKAVIFLNPSVVGPILPKYWPDNVHWSEIFTSRLNGDVHAVGTSVVCLAEPDKPKGPRIEGFFFVATPLATKLAYYDNVFSCKKNKEDSIITGEYRFTHSLIKNNLNIDTMLLKYGSIDWRNRKYWDCNNNTHPSRFNKYDDISIHPLEVVFHKPVWQINDKHYLHDVYLKEIKKYLAWAKERDAIDKQKILT